MYFTATSRLLIALIYGSFFFGQAFVLQSLRRLPIYHYHNVLGEIRTTTRTTASTKLFTAKGFGKGDYKNNESSSSSSSPVVVTKTYGSAVSRPIRDLIDAESAMQDFFTSREEWLPLFRSMIISQPSSSCAAMEFLASEATFKRQEEENNKIDFHETSSPWRLLQAIPDREDHRAVLASFLDGAQNSLLSIPTNEHVEEDDNDVQFVEEGRRLLALSRFHVLQANSGGSGVETYDSLFATCWSELHHLSSQNVAHTGSLIILPDYQFSDLRRFTDMNVLRPLEWLGLHADFEVASIDQGSSPAIRLLYKLSDIPVVVQEPNNDMEDQSSTNDGY